MKILKSKLNFRDKILFSLFKNYTYKIYHQGVIDGFNWYD